MASLEDIINDIKQYVGERNTILRSEVQQYLTNKYQFDQDEIDYVINSLPNHGFFVRSVRDSTGDVKEIITYRGENHVEKLPPDHK